MTGRRSRSGARRGPAARRRAWALVGLLAAPGCAPAAGTPTPGAPAASARGGWTPFVSVVTASETVDRCSFALRARRLNAPETARQIYQQALSDEQAGELGRAGGGYRELMQDPEGPDAALIGFGQLEIKARMSPDPRAWQEIEESLGSLLQRMHASDPLRPYVRVRWLEALSHAGQDDTLFDHAPESLVEADRTPPPCGPAMRTAVLGLITDIYSRRLLGDTLFTGQMMERLRAVTHGEDELEQALGRIIDPGIRLQRWREVCMLAGERLPPRAKASVLAACARRP